MSVSDTCVDTVAEDDEYTRPDDDDFTLLADHTRIEIIRALGGAPTLGAPGTLFAELRHRADVSAAGGSTTARIGCRTGSPRGWGRFPAEPPGVRISRAIEAGISIEDV